MSDKKKYIGKRVVKKDAMALLAGKPLYTDDLAPADCLIVEDAEAGIEAGVAGGFRTAGLGEASGYPKTNYRLEQFSDLLKIVL